MREYIDKHPNYKHDSILSDHVIYDMLKTVILSIFIFLYNEMLIRFY